MVSRREVIGGLVGAAVAPGATAGRGPVAPANAAGQQGSDSAALEKIEQAVLSIRAELEKHRQTARNHDSDAVHALRNAMRPHFRANRRFPLYIEVGWGIWIDVYDWHVGTQQPLAVSQLPDGRYTLRLMQTTLILRPDVEDSYISTPFDELVGGAGPAPSGLTP